MLRTVVFSGFFLLYSLFYSHNVVTLRLFEADQTLYEGEAYSFPFYNTNFTDVAGFSFALNLSTEYLDSAGLCLANLYTSVNFYL